MNLQAVQAIEGLGIGHGAGKSPPGAAVKKRSAAIKARRSRFARLNPASFERRLPTSAEWGRVVGTPISVIWSRAQ